MEFSSNSSLDDLLSLSAEKTKEIPQNIVVVDQDGNLVSPAESEGSEIDMIEQALIHDIVTTLQTPDRLNADTAAVIPLEVKSNVVQGSDATHLVHTRRPVSAASSPQPYPKDVMAKNVQKEARISFPALSTKISSTLAPPSTFPQSMIRPKRRENRFKNQTVNVRPLTRNLPSLPASATMKNQITEVQPLTRPLPSLPASITLIRKEKPRPLTLDRLLRGNGPVTVTKAGEPMKFGGGRSGIVLDLDDPSLATQLHELGIRYVIPVKFKKNIG